MTSSLLFAGVAAALLIVDVGAVAASAATLGGLSTGSLGTSDGRVSIHSAGVTAEWTPALSGTTWIVGGVTLRTPAGDGFAAGERVRVGLIATSGALLCEFSAVASSATSSLVIARATVDAACGAGIAYSGLARVAISAVR